MRTAASLSWSSVGSVGQGLRQASGGGVPEAAWRDRPEAGRIYQMIETLERKSAAPPKRQDMLTRSFAKIGRGVYDFGGEAMLSRAFLGRLMSAVVEAARHPGGIRWPAWLSGSSPGGRAWPDASWGSPRSAEAHRQRTAEPGGCSGPLA